MRKPLGLILALVLIVGTLSISGIGAAEGTDALDTSKLVNVKIFAITDAPRNQTWANEYYEILNGIFKERLNCTFTLDYTAGNEAKTNQELVLASGEAFDLIYTGSLPGYAIPANKGAFKDLTDMVAVYAPYIWGKVSEASWNEVKVNGKIYGVPCLESSYSAGEFMYRRDLATKYDLPDVTDLETMELYLQTIKDNEPELLPTNDFGAGFYGNVSISTTRYRIVDPLQESNCNFVLDPASPHTVLNVMETPEYKEFMYLAKDWADKGFWPSSCLSNMEWGVTSVVNGKAAASFNAIFPWYAWHPPFLERENPGWDIEFFENSRLGEDSYIYPRSAASYMYSSTRNAENTERGLMLLNLIQSDRELHDLCYYGIEGKHYKLTEDGKIDTTFLDITTEGFNYFPHDPINNIEFKRTPVDQWEEYDEHMNYIIGRAQNDILAGFMLDLTPVEAQYTAINQLRSELGMPLQAGLVDDVDAALEEYISRVHDAGIEEVRLEFERQVNAFLEANGRG